MAYRHNIGVYDPKFHKNRDRRELEDMLGEWYGKKFAASEITCRTEEPRKLSDTLDQILQKHINDQTLKLMELKEKWDNIIAPPMNRFVKVAALKEDVLYLEVTHPAFLMELRKQNVAAQWQKKIVSAVEGLTFENIAFVPAGQNRQL